MATSGSFHSTIESGHYWLQVDWSASQNVSNNTSTITATIRLWNDYSLSIGSKSGTIKINDKSYSFTSSGISSTGWHTLGKVTSSAITHNSDGTKSISISCTWNIRATISGHYYSSITTSSNITLNTIPRASSITGISSSSGYDFGSPLTVNISRASSSFTHKVYYTFKEKQSVLVGNNVGTSCTFTPSLSDCNYIPNATSGTSNIRVDTYSGSTKIGQISWDRTLYVPDSVKPTFNSFSISLDNSKSAKVNEWGVGVVGYTKVHFDGSASGIYSSTIKKYQIAGGLSQTVSGSSLNYTSGVINQSGNISFRCQAIDSRGRYSNVKTQNISILPYSIPVINYISSGRETNNNKQVHMDFEYSYSSVNEHNEAFVKLYYKKNSASTWTQYNYPLTGSTISSGDRITTQVSLTLSDEFDETASYNFKLEVSDSLGNQADSETLVSTIEVLMDFRAGGHGLGIGKIAESDSCEINLPAMFYKPISVPGESDALIPLGEYVDGIITSNTEAKVLWSGGNYMNESQVITLSEPISSQHIGVILSFSSYSQTSSSPNDFAWEHFVVPKEIVTSYSSRGHRFNMFLDFFGAACSKYLYFTDTTITGHASNTASGTGACGITYNNSAMVLRKVIGF